MSMSHPRSPLISVVIPFRNASTTLEGALRSLGQQTFRDYEVILIDDCSTDNSFRIASKFPWLLIRNDARMGPARSRNTGIKNARGTIFAFMDADCVAEQDWLKHFKDEFESDRETGAIAGSTRIPVSTFLGDCISELGFPGGANAGFERIWHVSSDGCTNHFSSCNFAVRRSVLNKYGAFDETFPYAGGEDAELSHRLSKKGVRIRYCPRAVVWHQPRTSLLSFARWQLLRGRTNYCFKRKVGNAAVFVSLRVWSTWNIARNNLRRPRLFIIAILLALGMLLQQVGYLLERLQPNRQP